MRFSWASVAPVAARAAITASVTILLCAFI
jgi:hypothetical protein